MKMFKLQKFLEVTRELSW